MTVVGAAFVEGVLGVAAAALAACGVFLVFLDLKDASEPSRRRRRLSETWRRLLATPAFRTPGVALVVLLAAISRFVAYWYEQSPRNPVTGGAFGFIVLVAIPIAAVINVACGGSPFLVWFILGCMAGVVPLAMLSETRRAAGVASALAVHGLERDRRNLEAPGRLAAHLVLGMAMAAALSFLAAFGTDGTLNGAWRLFLGLESAGAGTVILSPAFWLTHLPMVPSAALVAVLAVVAKGAVAGAGRILGADAALARPLSAGGRAGAHRRRRCRLGRSVVVGGNGSDIPNLAGSWKKTAAC